MKNLDFYHLLLLILLVISAGVYIFYKIKQRMEIDTFIKVYPGVKTKMSMPPKWLLSIRYTLYVIVTILLAIAILNPSFSEDGNRLGIIAFAGVPFLYCPMTTDIAAFSDYVRGLDVDMIPNTGTNLKRAFGKAEEIFKSGKVLRNKILILVTDGEDIKGSTPSKIEADILIWGVGTEEGGNIFYKDEQSGVSGFVTRTGNLVSDKSNSELIRTKLDEEFLLELAAIQKADYSNISANPASADNLLQKINSMNKNTSSKLSNLFKKDGYQYFLYPVVILLLLDMSLLEFLFKKKMN